MKIKLKPIHLVISVVILIFGGIALSDSLNYWETESSKVPAKYTSGEYEGSYNPSDIRGSYSFQDINENFEIPIEHLAQAFGLLESENAKEFLCKDLESKYEMAAEKGYEIGTDSVRVFVALYKGLPIELADVYIPNSAYLVLKDNANLSSEQITYAESHNVDLDKLEIAQTVETPADKNSEEPKAEQAKVEETKAVPKIQEDSGIIKEQESSIDKQIKGKTTFRELIDWGVSEQDIEVTLGKAMPNATLSIRDFCTQQGIEFSEIKTALQEVVDKK